VWQLTASNAITRLSDVAFGGNSFTSTLPPQSITLFVLPGGAPAPTAPSNLRVVR
jgi:O-glycosyl hydrolase